MVVYVWNSNFGVTNGVMDEDGQPTTAVGGLSAPPQEVVFRQVYGAEGGLKFGLLNRSHFNFLGMVWRIRRIFRSAYNMY